MITFNEEQEQAIDIADKYINNKINKKFITLSGPAGSGKTTLLKEVIKRNKNKKIIGGAISHSATKVLHDAIEIPTMSLAKILNKRMVVDSYGNKRFVISTKKKLPISDADVIVIDECSMIDADELDNILKYKNFYSKLIFVGDIAQLPPINSSTLVSTTFENKIAELTKIMRSKYPLNIINDYFRKIILDKIINNVKIPSSILSHKIEFSDISEGDKSIYTIRNKDDIVEIFKDNYNHNNPNSCKIIAYKNDTIDYYNNTIRKKLFNADLSDAFIEGDIILSQSNYYLNKSQRILNNTFLTITKVSEGINRDVPCYYLNLIDEFGTTYDEVPVLNFKKGYGIYKSKKRKFEKLAKTLMTADMWRIYYNFIESFAYFTYGYAVTSHKAQGQTIENVIVYAEEIKNVKPISLLEKLQSIYVGVSRASNKIFIY